MLECEPFGNAKNQEWATCTRIKMAWMDSEKCAINLAWSKQKRNIIAIFSLLLLLTHCYMFASFGIQEYSFLCVCDNFLLVAMFSTSVRFAAARAALGCSTVKLGARKMTCSALRVTNATTSLRLPLLVTRQFSTPPVRNTTTRI